MQDLYDHTLWLHNNKSDDVAGRTQAYEAIVKKAPIKKPNIPESFNVLIKELQAIWLDVDLLDQEEMDQREDEMEQEYEKIVEIEKKLEEEQDKKDEQAKKDAKK